MVTTIILLIIIIIIISLYYYKFENFKNDDTNIGELNGDYFMTYGSNKRKISINMISNKSLILVSDNYRGYGEILGNQDVADVYIYWNTGDIPDSVGYVMRKSKKNFIILRPENTEFEKIPYSSFFKSTSIKFINKNSNNKNLLIINTKNDSSYFTFKISGESYISGFGCIADKNDEYSSDNYDNIKTPSYKIYFHSQNNPNNNNDIVTFTGRIYKKNEIYIINTDELLNWIHEPPTKTKKKQLNDKVINIKNEYNKLSSCLTRNPLLIGSKILFNSAIRNKRYNCTYNSRPILNKISEKSNIKYFPVENNTIINKIVGNRNAIGFLIKKDEIDKIKHDLTSPTFIDIYSDNTKYPMCTLLPCNNSGDTCAIKSEDFKDIPFLKDVSDDYLYLIKAINNVCNINYSNKEYKVEPLQNVSNCNEYCNLNQSKCVEARVSETGEKMTCNNSNRSNMNLNCKCISKRNLKVHEVENISDINQIPTRNNTCRRVCLKQGKFCANLIETENNHTRFKNCNTVPNRKTTSKCICEESDKNIKSIDLIRTDVNADGEEPIDINYIKLNDYKVKVDITQGYKTICAQGNTKAYLNIPTDDENVSVIKKNNNSSLGFCNRDCALNDDCNAFTYNTDNNINTCTQYKYNQDVDTETYYKCDKKFYNSYIGKITDTNLTELILEPECTVDNNPKYGWENSYEIASIDSVTWGSLNSTKFFKDAKWIWSTSNAEYIADIASEITFKYQYCSYKPHENATLNICIDNTGYFQINNSNKIQTQGGWGNGSGGIKFNIVVKQGINNIKVVARNLGTTNNPAGIILTVLGDDKEYLFSTNKDWLFKEALICDIQNTDGEAPVVIADRNKVFGVETKNIEVFDEKAKWLWCDYNKDIPPIGTFTSMRFKYEFCSKSDIDNIKIYIGVLGLLFNIRVSVNGKNIKRIRLLNDKTYCTRHLQNVGFPACKPKSTNVDNLYLNFKKGINTVIVNCSTFMKISGIIISAFDLNKKNIFNSNKEWRILNKQIISTEYGPHLRALFIESKWNIVEFGKRLVFSYDNKIICGIEPNYRNDNRKGGLLFDTRGTNLGFMDSIMKGNTRSDSKINQQILYKNGNWSIEANILGLCFCYNNYVMSGIKILGPGSGKFFAAQNNNALIDSITDGNDRIGCNNNTLFKTNNWSINADGGYLRFCYNGYTQSGVKCCSRTDSNQGGKWFVAMPQTPIKNLVLKFPIGQTTLNRQVNISPVSHFTESELCNIENNVGTAVHIVGQNGRTQIGPWNKGTEIFSQDAKWIWNNPHGGTWSPAAPANVYITFRYKFCYPKNDINAKLFVIIDNTTSPNGYIKFNNNSITNDRNGSLHWNGGWGAVCNSNDKNNIMSGGKPSCNLSYGKVLIKKGANTIEVKCRNAGSGNNPAGFIISCFDKENNNIFNTNKDWKVIPVSHFTEPETCGPGTYSCENAVGYCFNNNTNEMVSTYRLSSSDPVQPNRNIEGRQYYFRNGSAKKYINMTNKANNNNCTLNPPPVPKVCMQTGKGVNCKFKNGTLASCNTLTSDYVCKENQTKLQRGNNPGWTACPYAWPGNWRWQGTTDSNGTVTKCSPPATGVSGYGPQHNFKYGPNYYLQYNE